MSVYFTEQMEVVNVNAMMLPNEIWTRITDFVLFPAVLSLMCTCRRFRYLFERVRAKCLYEFLDFWPTVSCSLSKSLQNGIPFLPASIFFNFPNRNLPCGTRRSYCVLAPILFI